MTRTRMLNQRILLVFLCCCLYDGIFAQLVTSVTICEHSKFAYNMTCPSSQYITILNAMYGRMERNVGGCSSVIPPPNGCKAANSLSKAREFVTRSCGSRPSTCDIRASNDIFGDPCVGKRKYLKFRFQCVIRERTEFLNQPLINGNLSLGNTITLSGCNYIDNINKPENLKAVWLKEHKNISSAGIEPLGDQQFTLGPLRIHSATPGDEGNYRCGIMLNGVLKATSTPSEVLLSDVIRVKFVIAVQALVPQFYQRKRRDTIPTDERIIEKIRMELDKTVLRIDDEVQTRYVRSSNYLTLYISKRKGGVQDATQLFDRFKFLQTLTSIDGFRVTVSNKDFCDVETIGNPTFKGEYTYPSSPIGIKITKKCVHGTMNVNIQNFTRTCLESGKWTPGDLDHCLAETKTTQELLNLNKNPVCQTPTQQNCEKPVQVARQLVSIVSSSQVISIPEEVSLVSNIINELANNINRVTTKEESNEILTDAIDVTSAITDVQPDVIKVADKTTDALQNVRQGLEKIATHVLTFLPTGTNVKISKPNIGFVGAKVRRTDLTIAAIDSGGSLESSVSASEDSKLSPVNAKTVMKIPESVLDSNSKEVSLFSFSYRTDTLFGNDQNKTAGSHILSVTFDGQKFENLLTPINITFTISSNALDTTPNCSFWDEAKDVWSTKGLTTNSEESGEKTILCQTTHLTNFALIIDVSQSRANPLALQVITWIGCGISLGGLILTVISYSAFRRLRRRLVPRLLLCLSVSLIATLLLFLLGVERSGSQTTCQIFAALIQYFLLVSFCWMAAQGINLYKKMVRVLKLQISDSQYFFRSFMVCTVFPAIIVVISASSKSEYYGDANFCLVHGLPFYIGLVLPICVIILLNIVLLILVLHGIHNTPANIRTSKSIDDETPYLLKLTRITIACSVLLGVTWLFGFMAVGALTEVMQYLFCIFNSLQGFFIFVFYTLTNEEVKKEWANLLGWEAIINSFSQTTTKKSTLHLNARSKSHTSTSSINANNTLNTSSSSESSEPRYADPGTLKENEYSTIQDVQRESAPYRSQAINVPREIKSPIYFNR